MNKPTLDQVVEKYIATRDEIAARTKALEDALVPLKQFQEAREQYMLGCLREQGAQNVKTHHGTVYQLTKDSVTMADWDAFFEWGFRKPLYEAMKEAGLDHEVAAPVFEKFFQSCASEFLQHAVSKKAVQERLGGGEAPPPGINYTQIQTVGIRKS